MKKIVLFASGSGSNVENIVNYFNNTTKVEIGLVLTNNPKAGVIERCKNLNLSLICFNRKAFYSEPFILEMLKTYQPDLIVLAGFLWKIPPQLIEVFPRHIINIHPALLPKYGGKGMYGRWVHEAVKNANEKQTGITIHWVNEHYDEGAIISQKSIAILPDDTADDIATKVHLLEYQYYPQVIQQLLKV